MKVSRAVKRLTKALLEDKGFYYSYQANIAMAFYDELIKNKEIINYYSKKNYTQNENDLHLTLHEITNNAAKRFLDSWCYISSEI